MADTYTTALKARKPEQGSYVDTWGTRVNEDALELLDDGIAGTQSVDLGSNTTYSLAALGNGADSESRAMRLKFTGTPASAVTVTVPASVTSKLYIVDNQCGQSLTIKYAATTGVTYQDEEVAFCFCDGTDVFSVGKFKYQSVDAVPLNLHDYIEDDGSYNVMGFIPQNLKSAIRARTSTADVSTYWQNAIDASLTLRMPIGLYNIEAALTGRRGLTILGANRIWSTLEVEGAINGFTFTESASEPDRGSLHFENFTMKGTNSALTLISLTTAGMSTFRNMKFWKGISLVKLATECHSTVFENCIFQGWTDYGVNALTGLNSVIGLIRNRFQIITSVDGSTVGSSDACVAIEDCTNLEAIGNECNGDTILGNFLRLNGDVGRMTVRGNFCEHFVSPVIYTTATGLIHGCEIVNNDLSTSDSNSIDFSAGSQAHIGVKIRNIRRDESGAGNYIFNPGATSDFEYEGAFLSGSADHVNGFAGYRKVSRDKNSKITVENQSYMTIGMFYQDNVPASQTDISLTGDRWVAPRAGSITAIIVKSTEARTAGTCTVEVRKNTGAFGASGSATGLTAILDGTNTVTKVTTQGPGTDTFNAGDELYVAVTTSGTWAPTTADIRVYMEVCC